MVNCLMSLTGVVSGVASTAASGGDVPLLLLLLLFGVDGVDLLSWADCSGGGLLAGTIMLGDQKALSSSLLLVVLVTELEEYVITGVQEFE